MLHFANKGVPVLPVHDSFIIAAQHQKELVAVMKRIFGERFGGADIKVTVKLHPPSTSNLHTKAQARNN